MIIGIKGVIEMTDKEKIIQCFNEVLLNKKSRILAQKYDKYDLISIKINEVENNEIWFTFDNDGNLTNFY
jgi:hypothetical protein